MRAPYFDDGDVRLYVGDALDVLGEMTSAAVDCVVTSPPYWGLRDYGTSTWEGGDAACTHEPDAEWIHRRYLQSSNLSSGADGISHTQADAARAEWFKLYRDACPRCGARRVDLQLGLEQTPEQYVAALVDVFREVRRVLKPTGTLWLNLGDSYAVGPSATVGRHDGQRMYGADSAQQLAARPWAGTTPNLKPKDLVGIPWRVAFALQADGWWLRSDIVWAKPNPMPDSVTDRPTKAHEFVFMLAKARTYFFDQEAVREPWSGAPPRQGLTGGAYAPPGQAPHSNARAGATWAERKAAGAGPDNRYAENVHDTDRIFGEGLTHTLGNPATGRNIRTVWEIPTRPYAEAHFATYPERLVKRCLLAGCPAEVCGTCGKPRERIAEKVSPIDDAKRQNRIAKAEARGLGRNRATGMAFDPPEVTTLGFSDCGHDDYRPGVVLDPFFGSGTTALAARNLGRHAVGIELNPEYAELAARRLAQQQLPIVDNEGVA